MRHILTSVILAMSLSAVTGCMTAVDEPTDETSQSVVQCDDLVTRTQGFWANHSCVIKGEATGVSLLPVSIGASVRLEKPAQVDAYLGTPPKGNKLLVMGHQLVAAKLNVAAFHIGAIKFADWNGDGSLESVSELISIADGLYNAGSDADRVKMATILDKLNNAGDAAALYFDPTCKSAPVAPPPACE
jgi:hypothetical protein